jgi:hypothetical protein
VYLDDCGRSWEGPYSYTSESIEQHAEELTRSGVYQLLYRNDVMYIGIPADGESMLSRLRSELRTGKNGHLSSLRATQFQLGKLNLMLR